MPQRDAMHIPQADNGATWEANRSEHIVPMPCKMLDIEVELTVGDCVPVGGGAYIVADEPTEVVLDIGDDDSGTVSDEKSGGGSTDAAGATGDESHLAF